MTPRWPATSCWASSSQPALGGLSVWTQPNSWQHFMSDHVVSFSVLPLAANRTLLRTRWLVHKDAQEGVDYDVNKLSSVWIATNAQDSALVERTHLGVSSPAYQPGPYSPYTEGLGERFLRVVPEAPGSSLKYPTAGHQRAAARELLTAPHAALAASSDQWMLPAQARRDSARCIPVP